jgi:tRNA pseudouridine55 synthase
LAESTVVDGLVVVDKPSGWTSHDVVARCRKIFGQKRVGHSGTLDPGATGVLLVGLGRVTRLLRFLADLPKSYDAEVVLGVETTTLDADGEVVTTHDMSGVTVEAARAAAAQLTGDILQVPPMVSAVKVGGKRLHALARRGEEVERAEVACSSGTYVRSLAADLGRALGGGAHLRDLRRTTIGSFTLADAVPLDRVGPEHVCSPAVALRDYPAVTVGPDQASLVRHGRGVALDGTPEGPYAVVDQGGDLLAIHEGGKPVVVLATH